MPAFFVPYVLNPRDATQAYARYKTQIGIAATDRQIWRLTFVAEGRAYVAEVGQREPRSSRVILAIFETKETYILVLSSRTTSQADPLIIPKADAHTAVDFIGK